MSPDRELAEDPDEWLRRSRSNLAKARLAGDPDILLEDLCFDAQQAVEKALKAVFVSLRQRVPRTHAIADLITALDAFGISPPADVREAAILTDYAVAARRYPGPPEPVTTAEHLEAIRITELVVAWATLTVQTRRA